MEAWKERLSSIGEVVTLDYDYMREGRRRPDPLPLLIAAHQAALQNARQSAEQRVVLIGKSMGGRISCHLSLKEPVNGVVCLGYPLCGGGDPAKLRDKVLHELRTPILFVQGTRDGLCPLELLAKVRAEMTAQNFLHVVEGGDHSLIVAKKQLKAANENQESVDRRVLAAIENFVGSS